MEKLSYGALPPKPPNWLLTKKGDHVDRHTPCQERERRCRRRRQRLKENTEGDRPSGQIAEEQRNGGATPPQLLVTS
jgi:hypothetical protein